MYASASVLDYLKSLRSGSSSTSTSTSTGSSTSTGTSSSGSSGSTTTTTTSNGSYSSQTLTYTPSNWSQPLQGDLFLPKTSGTHPIVLLMHGGGWNHGDKSSMDGAGKALAQRGYAAFSINYRLTPGSIFPSQLQDMQQALRWLQQHSTEYKLDMNRLATWGYSAGGHLSALLAVQPASDLPTVKVAIDGAGPTDLTVAGVRDNSSVKALLGTTYDKAPALYDQASPISYVHAGIPPVFIYQGTADTTVPPAQSQAFADALKAAGVPVQLVWLQGYDHSGASGATSLYRDKAFAFLDRYIDGSGMSGGTATDTSSSSGNGSTAGSGTTTDTGSTAGSGTTTGSGTTGGTGTGTADSGSSTGGSTSSGSTSASSGSTTTSSSSSIYTRLRSFLRR